MLNKFYEHYLENYTPSWLSFFDESINYFLEDFCPVFMSVSRKPHSFGNEYHRIADGDEGYPVMNQIETQEGKDRTKDANGKWAFPSKFQGEDPNTGRKYTNTSSLMCEMTAPLHSTAKVVSIDSGFC